MPGQVFEVSLLGCPLSVSMWGPEERLGLEMVIGDRSAWGGRRSLTRDCRGRGESQNWAACELQDGKLCRRHGAVAGAGGELRLREGVCRGGPRMGSKGLRRVQLCRAAEVCTWSTSTLTPTDTVLLGTLVASPGSPGPSQQHSTDAP